ncbi:MAG: tripartite tricarboxylate transporter substrate binding protein [Comamonas sp.]|uniref:Bug family tripartite tricarboxylate transporter substrate binding protein n=1 Tax=Comamonas sp. TaxID=34028 RepID=UPI002FCC8D9A
MKLSSILRVGALALAPLLSVAHAADFPSKPIRIIVPFAAGGSTDAVARLVGTKLAARLGQPVVVENKPGGSEVIASTFVAQSPPDGHIIFLSTMTGLTVNPSLYSKLAYAPKKDFAPLVLAATIPSIFVVNPSVPVKTMAELPAYLKAHPATAYGSGGNGTPNHLATEMYKRAIGAEALHVPYKGGAPALADLMAGQLQLMVGLMPEALPLVKANKLRAIGITTLQRSPEYPELPTVAESGVPGFEMIFWSAFVVPAATPKNVQEILHKALDATLQEPDVRAQMKAMGIVPGGGSQQELARLIDSDTAKWKKVIDAAGIKAD